MSEAARADLAASERGFALERFDRFLVARFATLHRVASWAIVGGGVRDAEAVAWMEVGDRDLRPPVDAVALLRDSLASIGLARGVGLMTSRALDAYVTSTRAFGEARATCVATVGLGNALRAGDPPGPAARIGTINVLVRVDRPLRDEALLEAIAIATEAKTAAVIEAGVPSALGPGPATGTGTDCVAIAAPIARAPLRYAGKHTEVGAAIGASVEDAIRRGARAWLDERGMR